MKSSIIIWMNCFKKPQILLENGNRINKVWTAQHQKSMQLFQSKIDKRGYQNNKIRSAYQALVMRL